MRIERSGPRWATAAIVSGGIALVASFSQPALAAVLSYQSIDTPSLAVFNGKLFMAYTGTDSNQRLNYAVTWDGTNWSQVTDTNNRSGGGPAIAVFNGKMYVAFPGINDHRINIASSTDGQHYSSQYVINSGWVTNWRPALGSGGGRLWLAWQGQDNGLYTAYTTNGANWTFGPIRHAQSGTIPTVPPTYWSSQVAWPPTLAPSSNDGSTPPNIVYTWSQSQQEFGISMPNQWQITRESVMNAAAPATTCHKDYTTTGARPQGGLGYLTGEVLMPYIEGGSIGLDINGGSCVASGITYPGPYGNTGVAPAAVGWNGHAYIAYTGSDSAKHINFLEVF
jgi:hypothetical protein